MSNKKFRSSFLSFLSITVSCTTFVLPNNQALAAAGHESNQVSGAKKSSSPQAAVHTKASSKSNAAKVNNDDLLKEVFAITARPQTQENMDRLFSLEKEGQAFLDKGENSKALLKFQEMYGLCKELKYGDGEGRALERMAHIYLAKGDKTRAKGLIENAMEVLGDSADKKSMGRVRVTASQVYLALDNPLWSLRQLDLAMKDFSTAQLVDHEEAARAMILAGNLALKIDKQKEAVNFYRAAANYYGQCGDRVQEVNLYNLIAGMLQESGLYTAAFEEAQKAVLAARQSKDEALLAASLTQLASCQYALCEYMNARKSMEEMFSLPLGKQPPAAWAVSLEAHAFSLAATGDYVTAKDLLDKCWDIWKNGGSALHKAQVLNALGVLNTRFGKPVVAVEQLKQAVDAAAVINPRQEKFSLRITQNLASALSCSGQNRAAKLELENTLRTMSKSKTPDQQFLGQIYAALGEICLQLKEIPQADAYVRKSIEVCSKINDDAILWRDYVNLAKIQIGLQQSPQESLVSAASYFRSPQAGEFHTCEWNIFPVGRQDMACDLVSLLISNNMVEQALITADQIKEENFIAEWQSHGGAVKTVDAELYQDLVHERAHLHAAERSSTPDKMLKQWQDWLRRVRMLTNDNRELARLIFPIPLNFAELSRQAQERQLTVLDYLIGPRQSFLFTIDRHGKIFANKLAINRDSLKAQVSSVLAVSTKGAAEDRQTEKRLLQSLYSVLLPEAVVHLLPTDPEQQIVFVPDSVLYNFPLAGLIDPQGRYLIESHTISSVPGMLGVLSASGGGIEQSLVLSSSESADVPRQTQEASEISGVFAADQVVKLVDDNNKFAQLEEKAKENSVLHFTADLPLQESSKLKATPPFVAEAKSNGAEGLFKLNLPSNLAVWSATTVNYKDSQGDGVKVFSRGLSYAGVRNILFSLWLEPEPQRTAELVEFYRGRQQGLNQAQSLRKAQLLSLAKDPSLHSWAAFQLIGTGM
ncbi:MAG: CHAT domain-containing protein [Candidatus Obscuribacterales bacterium]|nr:CHAT domain-containing protein [Candidatus Obscuribacterales bacterium]